MSLYQTIELRDDDRPGVVNVYQPDSTLSYTEHQALVDILSGKSASYLRHCIESAGVPLTSRELLTVLERKEREGSISSAYEQLNALASRAKPKGATSELRFTNEQWDKLVEDVFNDVKRLSATKGAEYSGDIDRLDNFRRGAREWGVPKELILSIYAGKHADAIKTYVNDLREGRTRERSEPIDGRILDHIVYLILLLAMVRENDGNARQQA